MRSSLYHTINPSRKSAGVLEKTEHGIILEKHVLVVDQPAEIWMQNGVHLLMYKRLEGGKQVIDRDLPTGNGDLEGQGYVIDQRDDGVRYNIKGDYANSFDIGLYANIDSDDDYEVSFKTYGGTHDKNNPKFCRCYDVGIQFDGRQVRLRTEHEHNANGGGPYVEVESKAINIGNITKKWVGFRFIGIHTGEGD